ncbi:MAG: HD domain-containing phosphohydrolase [Sulfuricurvum sp.]|jgi:putative nucleotidyltransferase with HDIG domain
MNDILLLKQYCQSLNILYVEDDKEVNEALVKYLSKFFNHVETAFDGEEGLEKYKLGEFDIVLTDINMPKMNGIEMAKQIKAINAQQEIVIISAYTETDYFLNSIHLGISDYILKPISYEQMNSVLYKVASTLQIRKENKRFHESLYQLVEEQTKLLTDNYEQTIKAMVDLVESRDTYTGGHSERVAHYSKAIAQEMKLSDEECELIFRAGMLHDIGKVTTPDTILLKPGQLSAREYTLIQNHVTVSYDLLSKIPMYAKLSEIIIVHHERYDGHGYPKGLKGDEIPLLGRIMIIADAFDAMTTNRIYKGRMRSEDAILEIQASSGTQFDPKVVPFACKALSRIVINQDITQLPKNSMENERFAYFFHDSVTDNYNQEYLALFLQSISEENGYQACAYFLKNFSQYNNAFDWEAGNILLKTFSEHLSKNNPGATLFRVQGDDFILISKEPLCKECIQPAFFENTGVRVECYHLPVGDDFMTRVRHLEQQYG